MTQNITMAAPAAPSTTEPVALATTLGIDPSVVLALIAEVDAIFCDPADTPVRQRPAPPAVGCALDGPRRAGRSWRNPSPQRGHGPVRRVDPMQRSPPQTWHRPVTTTFDSNMTAWKVR